jgi:hypothetical protein
MQASPAPSKLQNCTTSTQSPLFRPPGGTRVATGCLHASRPTAMQICWVSATRDPARQLSHKFRSANRYEILALSLLLRLTTTLRAAQTGKVILGQGADTAYPPLLRNAAMPLRCRGTLLLCRPLQRSQHVKYTLQWRSDRLHFRRTGCSLAPRRTPIAESIAPGDTVWLDG